MRSSAPELPQDLADALRECEENPEDIEGWDKLEDVAREHELPDAVLALLIDVLNGDGSVELRVELGRRAADFCEEWFEDPERVLSILRQVLELDRSARWAFERLSLLLTVAGRWDDLLDEYDVALKACQEPSERVALLEEVARVARDFAGESHRANDYLKELLLLRPDDDQLAANLERRLEQQKRHKDLIDVWTARLPVLDSSAALATRVQIAKRYWVELRDADSALSSIDELLAVGDAEGEACELLEGLAADMDCPAEARRRALGTLEERYTAASRWTDVVRVLDGALLLAESDEARVALHGQVAKLLTSIDRKAEALEHCGAILRLTPQDVEVHDQARQLAEQSGEYGRYAVCLVDAADVCDDGPSRARFLIEAAQVQENALGEAPAAVALYARALAEEAAGTEAHLESGRQLVRLLVAEDQKPQRLDVLERLAGLEPERSVASELLGEAAELARELGDVERSLRLWQTRLDATPGDRIALSARIDLLEGIQRWDRLIADLHARSEALRTAEEPDAAVAARADLVRIAQIHVEQRQDLASAIDVWSLVESRFGRDAESLDSLVDLSTKAERYDDVVELLSVSLESEQDTERRIAQHGRLGDVLRLYQAQPSAAITQYRSALALAPRDEVARAGLRALLTEPEHAETAAETLADALRSADEWKALIDLVETRLNATSDPLKRRDVLLEAATLYEQRAGDLQSALHGVQRAFPFDPSAGIEGELLRLASLTGDFETAVFGYRTATESVQDEARLQELLMAQGRLEENELGRLADALQTYRRVLADAPVHREAALSVLRVANRGARFDAAAWAFVEHCRALGEVPDELVAAAEALVDEHGQWDPVVDAFADRVAGHDGLSDRVAHDLKRQLAIWHRDRRDDADSAEFVLRRAVKDYPNLTTLRMLAELQRRAPGRPLVLTLIAIADHADHELAALREAADVALRVEKDADLAQPILERALLHASARFRELANDVDAAGLAEARNSEAAEVTSWALERLVDIALGARDSARALQLLVDGTELPFEASQVIALRFRAAEIAALQADDGRAVDLCRGILELDPNHKGAITLLSSLYERSGQLDRLLELRQRELALGPDLERRLALRLDIAAVLGDIGGAATDRLTALRANLEEEPGHADSVNALAQVLAGLERYEELATLLGEQAEEVARIGDQPRSARLWARAGYVAEEKLNDVDRALSAFRNSVKLDPSVQVLDRLAAICIDREEHLAAASWLEQRFSLTPVEDRTAWRATLGALATALTRADDEAKARRFLEQGLETDPASDDARRQLAELYRAGEDWALLAPLLASGVRYAPTDAAKVEYLRAAAQVERRRLGNLEAAIPLLERAVDLDPSDRSLRLLLADGLLVASRYDESRELLTQLLDEFGRRRTRERASVHHHLAKIALATGDLDEALLQAEEASKIERTDPSILMLLAKVARQKGQLDRAEQAYRTLLLLVSRQAPLPSDEADAVGESTILFELYGIARDKGQVDRAQDLLDSALEVATRSPQEAALLEEALRDSGQSELLLQALDQRLVDLGEGSSDGAAAAQILLTKAQVLAKAGRLEDALATRLSALERTPQDGRLLESTKKLADELGQTDRLIEHLTTLAEQMAGRDNRAAGELWLRLGAYTETQPEGQERAAALYERAQETGHKPIQTFFALDRVLSALGDEARIRRALERFVAADGSAADPDVSIGALVRLASMELNEGSLDAGVAHLDQALSLGARSDQVIELVVAQIQAGARSPALVRLFARVAAGADKPTLLWALSLAAELEDASLETLTRAVELARELGDQARLEPLLERAIDVGRRTGTLTNARWILVELSELQRSAGFARRAADLLREAIELCAQAEEVGELALDSEEYLLELGYADLASGVLGDLAAAATSYEKLLAVAPADARVWRPLLAVYRKSGRTEDQAECLARVSDYVTDPEELSLLRMEGVRLKVEAGQLEEAEADLREIIAHSPSNEEAQTLLADLLDRTGRRDELRELLESLYNSARDRGDATEVAQSALRLARLLGEQDRFEAIGVLTASLTWTRENREVLVTLLGLYTEEDDPTERADVMENLIQVERGAAAEQLSLSLADLRRSLDDNYGVGRALELGFKVYPESEALGARLREWLTAEEDYSRLAEMLLVEAEHRADDSALANLDEAARIYAEILGDPLQAAETLARALKRAPDDMARLVRMVEHLVAVGEAERAVKAVGAALESASPEYQPRLLRMRAALRADEYADEPAVLAAAVEDLERAWELSGDEREEVANQLAALLDRLRKVHSDLADENGERWVVLRLAHLLPQIDKAYQALETLAGWLREHPLDVEVARQLGALSESLEDWGTASFAYARLLDASEGEERRNAALRFADAAEKAGTPMVARSALEAVQRENPGDETLRQRLRQVYEAAGAYAELGEILMNQADEATDPAEQFRLLREAGELFLRAEVGGAACEIFQRALALQPDAYDVVFQLAEAYLAVGEVDRASQVLEEAVEHHGKRRSPELSQLQYGLARVAYARGDEEGTLSWLEAALLTDRQNGEVAAELAIFAQERGKYDTAVKALQLVTLLKTPCSMSRAEAYLRQAMIAEHQGDSKKAVLLARRATAADPNYEEAQGFLAQLGG